MDVTRWTISGVVVGALMMVAAPAVNAQPLECFRCSWDAEPGWCDFGFNCAEVDPDQGDPNGRMGGCDIHYDWQCNPENCEECDHTCEVLGEPCEPPHEEQASRISPDGSVVAVDDAGPYTLPFVPATMAVNGTALAEPSQREVSCAGVVLARRYSAAVRAHLRESARRLTL